MIDEELKIIIKNMLLDARQMLKFLKTIKSDKYNFLLDELMDYTLCTEENIQTIEHYLYETEIKLYDLLIGGDCIEK